MPFWIRTDNQASSVHQADNKVTLSTGEKDTFQYQTTQNSVCVQYQGVFQHESLYRDCTDTGIFSDSLVVTTTSKFWVTFNLFIKIKQYGEALIWQQGYSQVHFVSDKFK